MEEQFVPYMIALKLKELGFNEECFGYYDNWLNYGKEKTTFRLGLCKGDIKVVPTLLWQQAFDWFREKYNYHSIIQHKNGFYWYEIESYNYPNVTKYSTMDLNEVDKYEEAKLACLEKLIEIYEQTGKNP